MSQSFIINLARGPLVYERAMLWTNEGKQNPDHFCVLWICGRLSITSVGSK